MTSCCHQLGECGVDRRGGDRFVFKSARHNRRHRLTSRMPTFLTADSVTVVSQWDAPIREIGLSPFVYHCFGQLSAQATAAADENSFHVSVSELTLE